MLNSSASILSIIKSTASLNIGITSQATELSKIKSSASLVNLLVSSATLVCLISSTATLINGGIGTSACPIIICIDGGDAFTTTYGPVNGLLNGGTA